MIDAVPVPPSWLGGEGIALWGMMLLPAGRAGKSLPCA